jgi:enoyl-CoA hydratase/carnithine racemase
MTALDKPLFNYNTLNVSLDSETRSMHLQLNRPEQNNALNTEMIFELESILAWLTGHVEINSVYLSGAGETFSTGFDLTEFKLLSEDKVRRNFTKLQKLIYSMYFLPQTFICSLHGEVTGAGIELALGADIRLVREDARIRFDHLQKGLVPTCGGIGFLSLHIPQAYARNWVMSGSQITALELKNSGFALESYEKSEDLPEQMLTEIAKQAPVARIQAKRSFLESIQVGLDKALDFERTIGFAAFNTRDWEAAVNAEASGTEAEFTPAREFGQKVKKAQQERAVPLDN